MDGSSTKKKTNIYRMLRIARDIRVNDLAKKMGCTASYICQIENGEFKPGDRWIYNFCKVIDIKPEVVEKLASNPAGKFEQVMLEVLKAICEADDQ